MSRLRKSQSKHDVSNVETRPFVSDVFADKSQFDRFIQLRKFMEVYDAERL